MAQSTYYTFSFSSNIIVVNVHIHMHSPKIKGVSHKLVPPG